MKPAVDRSRIAAACAALFVGAWWLLRVAEPAAGSRHLGGASAGAEPGRPGHG